MSYLVYAQALARVRPNKALQLTSAWRVISSTAAHCSLRSRGGSCWLAAGCGGLP
jgi:hypothetical protein